MARKDTNLDRDRDVNTRETEYEKEIRERREDERNEDPITGEPGSHPVGVGVGTAVGGAAAGLAAGAVGGPIGAGVGAVAGGIIGAIAGKGVAERIDPTAEEEYWRNEYSNRDYYDPTVGYEEVGPAYRYGWESRARHKDRAWDDVERDLERDWEANRGQSSMDWHRAKPATRDAWQRIDMLVIEDADQEAANRAAQGEHDPQSRTPRTPK